MYCQEIFDNPVAHIETLTVQHKRDKNRPGRGGSWRRIRNGLLYNRLRIDAQGEPDWRSCNFLPNREKRMSKRLFRCLTSKNDVDRHPFKS